jgi:putative aminopeptidase FrvX
MHLGNRFLRSLLTFLGCALSLCAARAQNGARNWQRLVNTAAVSGYEQGLAAQIRERLKEFSPKTDNLGNVIVTMGSGAPRRLIVAAIDEAGYVVSAITPDGYLRVQRLPQAAPNPVFDLLEAAQPVMIATRGGKQVAGVFAGLSVHLEPARQNAPKMAHPDEMYVDIGASSADEVRAAGIDLLDPLVMDREVREMGNSEYTAPAIGDRFAAVVLLDLLDELGAGKAKFPGTLSVAFITQQWTGGRGLERILNEISAEEMIYVGRLSPPRKAAGATSAPEPVPAVFRPGAGVLLGVSNESVPLTGLAAQLQQDAQEEGFAIHPELAAPPRIAGYALPTSFPEEFAAIGIPSLYPATPAETVSMRDARGVTALLYHHLAGAGPRGSSNSTIAGDIGLGIPGLLESLTETYGASGHEAAVRDAVRKSLPKDAKTETDAAGNLIFHVGRASDGTAAKKIVFVAHMDEIGYQVRSVESDGRLLVDVLGGGYTEYFMGHAVLVHKSDGSASAGILELPDGWDQPGFEWPHGPRTMDDAVHVYLGTHSAEETRKLGIQAGDSVTIPKHYHPLLGTRANARSFDDRVGCTALIEAVKALGADLPGRDVTFVWSTEEEVGLKGAAALAARMVKEGQAPDFVFAIDTFVSSDSPLESKRFADAEIGKGFVIRAIDNSNIAPREYVDRVVALARENKIPVQYGVTGGGNDGAVFVRYGTVDIPLSWPLRYAHSAAEVIDTRDVDALAKIVAVLAKNW